MRKVCAGTVPDVLTAALLVAASLLVVEVELFESVLDLRRRKEMEGTKYVGNMVVGVLRFENGIVTGGIVVSCAAYDDSSSKVKARRPVVAMDRLSSEASPVVRSSHRPERLLSYCLTTVQ